MGTRQLARKGRWFEIGAQAARRIDPTWPEDVYACPLCLRGFDRAAITDHELTVEHVPPKATGGRPMVLTCKTCNNNHGSALDAEHHAAMRYLRLTAGELDTPIRMRILGPGGYILHGEATSDAGGVRFHGVPAMNDQRDQDGALERWKAAMTSGDVRVELVEPFRPRRAQVSILRAAYLAAFAALGYRYITLPSLDPVRLAISEPDNSSHPLPVVFRPAGDPVVAVLGEPADLQGALFVGIERFGVVLPPAHPDDFYAGPASWLTTSSGKVDASLVHVIGWPSRPEHLLDLLDTTPPAPAE